MAEPNLDHPGDVTWYAGYGPAPVLGLCRRSCQHQRDHVIAWGPSYERYELVECRSGPSRCRAWSDDRGRITTAWLDVEPRPAATPTAQDQP